MFGHVHKTQQMKITANTGNDRIFWSQTIVYLRVKISAI